MLGLGNGMKRSGPGLPEPDALPPREHEIIQCDTRSRRSHAQSMDTAFGEHDRAHSIRLLGCREFEQVQPTLTRLLAHVEPQDVQLATLDVLADYRHAAIAPLVMLRLEGIFAGRVQRVHSTAAIA